MLLLVGFTLFLWLLPWGLMRMPRFLLWSGTYYGPMLEFSFVAPATTNADVVIFGDSSALFGIDPLQIKARTGLKVINLPNTISSLPVINDMALQRYVALNSPPKLIVFYFAPWNLNYRDAAQAETLYEGEEMLARHGSFRQLLAFARSHAAEAALFPFRFYSANSLTILISQLRVWRQDPLIVRHMGHADLVVGSSKLMKPSCRFPDKLLPKFQIDSALELARKYSTRETEVMFYMAPIPRCENVARLVDASYGELTAVPPKVMDPIYYDDDGYFIHLDHRGVSQATEGLLKALVSDLRPRMPQPGPSGGSRSGAESGGVPDTLSLRR